MDLNDKLVAAARNGGHLGNLTTEQVWALVSRGHAQYVTTTGRWVLTDAGVEAARQVEVAVAEGVR